MVSSTERVSRGTPDESETRKHTHSREEKSRKPPSGVQAEGKHLLPARGGESDVATEGRGHGMHPVGANEAPTGVAGIEDDHRPRRTCDLDDHAVGIETGVLDSSMRGWAKLSLGHRPGLREERARKRVA